MRIAVTGAAGFIGGAVLNHLLECGFDAYGIDIKPQHNRTLHEECDLRDSDAAREALCHADWVMHFAADMGGVGYFHAKDYAPPMNNMRIDLNVLRACEELNIQRMFYASSACIYPIHLQRGNQAPRLNEDQIFPANSDQMYGWEKLFITQLAQRAPFDCRVGIFHTIYGPGQEWQSERAKFPPSIVAKTLAAKETGEPVRIWGDGSQLRSYLYIDDAVSKIVRIMFHDENVGPINVGYDGAISCGDAADICADLADIEPDYIYEGQKPSGVMARDCDNSRFRGIFGDEQLVDYRNGFSKMLTWMYQEQLLAE